MRETSARDSITTNARTLPVTLIIPGLCHLVDCFIVCRFGRNLRISNMSHTTGPPGGLAPDASLPTDTRAPLVIGIMSMFIAIVAVFMVIRIYIRGYLLRGWGLDDSMFIWSSILVIVQGATVLCNVIYGSLGSHIWESSAEELQQDPRYLVTAVIMYQLAFACIKATFLLQYRRAFALPHITLFCDIFLGIMFLALSGLLISAILVTKNFLKPATIPDLGDGPFLRFSYVNAAVHLSTDVVIFILPLALVGKLRLATMQKAGLISSFGVGIFTSAISVLRIVSLPSATSGDDAVYQAVPLVLLSMAEPTSAVVCACVPIMRPLLACSGTSRYSSQGSRRPLPGATDDSAGQRRQTPSVPPQSPTSTISPLVAQMTHISTVAGSTGGDLEGNISSQRAIGSINARNPLTMHLSSPTRPEQGS
ncbi:hypothetical protein CORC01_04047 [Colletotrichum orchidophilum]|uniref:Rhodopsin domain-containing protein n=1 Tax=Colletotrichum orchidophilum TaxID=1209926 RepID=A0A1G4BGV4_9PEZI|nr:uncharacterized protein CORC01_04047 [Colletotrichum orchidophilum]OHF00730.1 hypothetical protein CORC01_04047 [Colletotrichum orchidophilum]